MRSPMSDRSRQRLRTILTILVTALIIAPAAALATHGFNDVNDGDFYHAAVDWMKANDVTAGCNPPDNTRYCPDDPVTRGEMAVFFERLDSENVFVRPGDDAVDGGNADTVDGMHAADFLGANQKAVDSDKLDGKDSSAFLGANAKAADANQLDGKDSTEFLSSSLNDFIPIARFKLEGGSVVDSEWRAPLTGAPTASFGSDRYRVDLPGITWFFTDKDDQVVCTSMSSSYYAATGSFQGDLLVYARDSSGTAVDAPVTCVVYDGE